MISSNNGVSGEPCSHLYALVIYVPDQLGRFLDDLRLELVPESKPRAHVSVLPPRPLAVDWQVASGELRAKTEVWQPFDIELTGISIFGETDVIYLELGKGAADLHEMHAAMANRSLAFREPFEYHPHVTLAQDIPHAVVASMCQEAERRWQEYSGPRRFRAAQAMFVKSTFQNCWIDLDEFPLGLTVAR